MRTSAGPNASGWGSVETMKPLTSSIPPGLQTGLPKSLHGDALISAMPLKGGDACMSDTMIDSTSIGLTASATTKLTATGLAAEPEGEGCNELSIKKGFEKTSITGSVRVPASTSTPTLALSKLAVANTPGMQGSATSVGSTSHCCVGPSAGTFVPGKPVTRTLA